MIPIKIGELTFWVENFTEDNNYFNTLQEMDLIDERRTIAYLRAEALRQQAALQYNKRVIHKKFKPGDLVLRRVNIGAKQSNPGGKLVQNWEGPYRITDTTGRGAYKLETLDHKLIKNWWNAANLRLYFS